MNKRNYIILHNTEWNRLNRKIQNKNAGHESGEREEYFKKLIETSQSWLKTWPDTVQGRVALLAQGKEKLYTKDKAFVKNLLATKEQEETVNALKKARQLIFEESCYGKQLTSALLASKILEERDAQVQFRRELKQEAKKQELEIILKQNLELSSAESQDKNNKLQKKKYEKELAEINKLMHETKLKQNVKEKEDQQKVELDNAELMQELLENERAQTKAYETLLRNDIKIYEENQKIIKQLKKEKAMQEEAVINAQQKEFDKRYCKIRRIQLEMNNKYLNETEQSKKDFQLIKNLQEDEKARYDNFVQAGIKAMEQRATTQVKNEDAKKNLMRDTNRTIAEANKKTAEIAKRCKNFWDKCYGDRQCIISKQERCGLKKFAKNKTPTQEKVDRLSFLSRPNTLVEELRQREKAPPSWSGLKGAHAQFAENAAATLRECRHKYFAKRIIDNYRKTNCLDSATLPVQNY